LAGISSLRATLNTGANPVFMESSFALFLFSWSHFLTANRIPPSDQVRGHASPENALAAGRFRNRRGRSPGFPQRRATPGSRERSSDRAGPSAGVLPGGSPRCASGAILPRDASSS